MDEKEDEVWPGGFSGPTPWLDANIYTQSKQHSKVFKPTAEPLFKEAASGKNSSDSSSQMIKKSNNIYRGKVEQVTIPDGAATFSASKLDNKAADSASSSGKGFAQTSSTSEKGAVLVASKRGESPPAWSRKEKSWKVPFIHPSFPVPSFPDVFPSKKVIM